MKNLQDEVSYVLVCAVEAWWAHNPQVLGLKPLEEINKIDDHAYANYPTKNGPNAQGPYEVKSYSLALAWKNRLI